MKNGLHSGGLNPRPISHESFTLTTRPWLIAQTRCCLLWQLIFVLVCESYKDILLKYMKIMKGVRIYAIVLVCERLAGFDRTSAWTVRVFLPRPLRSTEPMHENAIPKDPFSRGKNDSSSSVATRRWGIFRRRFVETQKRSCSRTGQTILCHSRRSGWSSFVLKFFFTFSFKLQTSNVKRS